MARILHVLASPRAEGAPRLVFDWVGDKEHEKAVLFLSGELPDLLAEFRANSQMLGVGKVLVPGPCNFWRITKLVREYVREYRTDVVVAWTMGFSQWVFLDARAAGSRAAFTQSNHQGTSAPCFPVPPHI